MTDREFGKQPEIRKIASLKFLYEISEDGRIFRNVKSKKQLKQWRNNNGYWQVFGSINGKKFSRTVHSLVAECWLGSKPEGYEIDHIDRDKNNNHYKNLRYATHSENNLNKTRSGKHPVILRRGDEVHIFESQKECAKFLAAYRESSVNNVRCKLAKHRANVYGYDVEYLPVAY